MLQKSEHRRPSLNVTLRHNRKLNCRPHQPVRRNQGSDKHRRRLQAETQRQDHRYHQRRGINFGQKGRLPHLHQSWQRGVRGSH